MQRQIEKLKEYIVSQKELHKNGDELTADNIECVIAWKIFNFCADNDLKAGNWNFKQFLNDAENEEIDCTVWMNYAQLEFDILETKISCDKAVFEIISFYVNTCWEEEE